MTDILYKDVQCKCGQVNRIIYLQLFNAEHLDDPLIQHLLKGSYATSKCKNCSKIIHPSVDILICGPERKVWVNTTDDPENIKNA
jgi:hypothetical protein